MKVCLVNGSPKAKRSTSGYLLDELENRLSETSEIFRSTWENFENELPSQCNTIVFAFPLYFDSISSNFLGVLENTEKKIAASNPGANIYIMVNNAFYEPENNRFAVQIMRHWCAQSGTKFCGALCIGAGPIVPSTNPPGDSISELNSGLDALAHSIISESQLTDNYFIEPSISRNNYLESSNDTWTKAAEKRGLTRDDLLRRVTFI